MALINNAANKEGKSVGNTALHKANKAKNDEFYTQISDIEKECSHYKGHFKNKIILCNCDDPDASNFWRYFHLNFAILGLKKLIAAHFVYTDMFHEGDAYKIEYTGGKGGIYADGDYTAGEKTALKENGDFRSAECIELLKEADIVVTNPPFSLFREYTAQLTEYGKKFLIIGNQNALTYKETFSLIKENKIWLGIDNGGTKWFRVPPHYDIKTETRIKIDENGVKYFSMGSIMWFTNVDHKKRHEEMILYRRYDPLEYPKYDNYNAINVDKVSEIPVDYDGVMGVPVTFLDKYNPEQFELAGIDRYVEDNPHYGHRFSINGKETYARILIKRRKP
ncbi:MAG: adenine-specific methyltransferase EcoRI family protein [Treponema sp.]|jgi:hypothetical protein|nr:adenine-specific methyltransferase EcoRI family protein [Treponema sp.]